MYCISAWWETLGYQMKAWDFSQNGSWEIYEWNVLILVNESGELIHGQGWIMKSLEANRIFTARTTLSAESIKII